MDGQGTLLRISASHFMNKIVAFWVHFDEIDAGTIFAIAMKDVNLRKLNLRKYKKKRS